MKGVTNGTKTAQSQGQPNRRARTLAGTTNINGERAAASPAAVPLVKPRTTMPK